MSPEEYMKHNRPEKFVRDKNSKAVQNTNNRELEAYKKRREQKREAERTKQELNTLKRDVKEIKDLLKELIGKS